MQPRSNHSRLHKLLLPLLLCTVALFAVAAPQARAPLHGSEAERRAVALLERAVAHVQAKGETGAADFSRDARFIDQDQYVYALRTDGTFLASGGASVALVGQNVLNETDLNGRRFFREIVHMAVAFGSGRVEYRWFNPADSRGEPKVALFRRVGELIVAAGFYPPRATATDARALLREATAAVSTNPEAAYGYFHSLDGPYIRDDLYVFVIRIADGIFLADGAFPERVGTSAYAVKSPDGAEVFRDMMRAARHTASGELEYRWRNPATGMVETKHSFFRLVDDVLVGVGYYRR
jgi:cytochrome c